MLSLSSRLSNPVAHNITKCSDIVSYARIYNKLIRSCTYVAIHISYVCMCQTATCLLYAPGKALLCGFTIAIATGSWNFGLAIFCYLIITIHQKLVALFWNSIAKSFLQLLTLNTKGKLYFYHDMSYATALCIHIGACKLTINSVKLIHRYS